MDYQNAAEVLNALPVDQLPRWQASPSSEIYSRLIDPASIAPCNNRIHQLGLRMQSCMALTDAISAITHKYLAATQADPSYAEDTAPIMGFMLRLATAMSETGDEFIASLDRSDPSFQTRQQGMAQFNSGITQMVNGAIYSLSNERALYSDAAAANLAQALAETFPILGARMPSITRAEFEGKLRQIASEDRSIEVRQSLAILARPAD